MFTMTIALSTQLNFARNHGAHQINCKLITSANGMVFMTFWFHAVIFFLISFWLLFHCTLVICLSFVVPLKDRFIVKNPMSTMKRDRENTDTRRRYRLHDIRSYSFPQINSISNHRLLRHQIRCFPILPLSRPIDTHRKFLSISTELNHTKIGIVVNNYKIELKSIK